MSNETNPVPPTPQTDDMQYDFQPVLHLGFPIPDGHVGVYRPTKSEVQDAIDFWAETEIRKIERLRAHLRGNESVIDSIAGGNKK